VVVSALAEKSDWLLSLDETDLHGNLRRKIYGMRVATPGQFLMEECKAGLL
jgi:hypothetical protein